MALTITPVQPGRHMTITGAAFHFESAHAQEQAIKRTIEDLYRQTPEYMGRGREALMNALEACQRADEQHMLDGTEYSPEVRIGPSKTNPDQLCYADNGIGLGRSDVERHLATISQSGNSDHYDGNTAIAEFDQNKGVGVKASLLPENRAGLDYISWCMGEEMATWFRLAYDHRQFPVVKRLTEEDGWDGDPTLYAQLTPSEEAEITGFEHIAKAGHGTILTLKGNDPSGEEHTLQSPSGAFRGKGGSGVNQEKDAIWGFLAFVNRRFWDFGRTSVKVCGEFHGRNASTAYYQAKGARHFLSRARLSGSVQLELPDGAPVTANWHVMNGTHSKKNNAEYISTGDAHQWMAHGHIAYKYRGEVYFEYYDSHTVLRRKLREFGIWKGEKLVCIYIDLDTLPDSAKAKLFSNQQRTLLYYDRKALTVDVFAAEFASLINTDAECVRDLNAYMQEIETNKEEDPDRHLEHKRYFQAYNLLTPTFNSVTPTKQGELIGDDEITMGSAVTGNRSTDGVGVKPPGKGGKRTKVRRGGHTKPGVANEPDLPEVYWNHEDSSQVGASYAARRIEVFRKWPVFDLYLDHFDALTEKETKALPTEYRRAIAWQALEKEIEKVLIGHALRVGHIAIKKKITFDEYATRTLSDDALTATLHLQPHTESNVMRNIKVKLQN